MAARSPSPARLQQESAELVGVFGARQLLECEILILLPHGATITSWPRLGRNLRDDGPLASRVGTALGTRPDDPFHLGRPGTQESGGGRRRRAFPTRTLTTAVALRE